jgi:uncharacterized protein (TIGR02118 family)
VSVRKVIAAIGGPFDDAAPALDGLVAYSVHRPHPDEPSAASLDAAGARVEGVVMAWIDGDAPLEPATWFDAPVTAYLVDERVQIEWTRDWPDGEATPAIEQLAFVPRIPSVTHEQFAEHWSERHTPLVRVHHPGMARYVQNVITEPLTPGARDARQLDGVAQLYFRTSYDLHERYFDSEEGQRIIFEDVAKFLERGTGWGFLAQETWIHSSSVAA